MAKFCTKCGKPLVEGQTCNCGNAETPQVENHTFQQPSMNEFKQTQQVNQNMGATHQVAGQPTASSNNLFGECLNIVKNFLKKPVSTIEANAHENKMVHSMIMIGLNAIAFAIFAIALVKELEEAIMSLMMSMMGLSSYGSYGVDLSASVEIPYIKIFLVTAVIIIAIVALAALLNWLLTNKLFKIQTNFKRILTVYGFSSIISTVCTLVGAICVFIDGRISLAVIAVGLFLSQHYVSVTTPAACNNADKNKLGYSVVLSILVSIAVVGFIAYKFMS